MKKLKDHKIKAVVLTILVVALGLFGVNTLTTKAVSNAPKSFTAGSEKVLPAYINGMYFSKLTNTSGGYVYCRDFHKKVPYGVPMTMESEAPAGIAYILSNGYPRKSITGNSDQDYYITQTAIWWYMDEHMNGNNLSAGFKNSTDAPALKAQIVALKDAASKVTSYATPAIKLVNNDATLHLTSDKAYYESNDISAKTLYTNGNYTVSLENAPEGTTIINTTTGATTNSIAPTESFKIRIPSDKVAEGNLNITVTATTKGAINKAYMYKSADPSAQSVIGSVLYEDTSTVTDKTTLNLSTSKVTIVKIDSKTNAPLQGATFELKDEKGQVIATWTSTTNAHVIKNLPNGTYTLKETKAPAGYILNDKEVNFTITDTNRNITINFKNTALEKSATILKIDATTKKPLAGATLVVKDKKGKEIARFTTTEEAYTLKDIADGEYTVEEVEAPKGYAKTDKVYKFTIDDNNRSASITIENKAIKKLAHILKVDGNTNKPLAGATLVVRDMNGNIVEEFVTTTEAHVIYDLADGEYTVEETKAPAGYKKSDEIVKFVISDKTPSAAVIFGNYEEVDVPYTGSNKSLISTIFGVILLLSGVGFVYHSDKKNI